MVDRPATPSIKRLRQLSQLLDNAIPIPGTKYRIGLDSILGLLPGGGDTMGLLLSAYIVWQAAQMGVPRETIVRMVSNILIDSAVGTIPVLGDLFDVAWKANAKNMELLETQVGAPETADDRTSSKWFAAALIALLILAAIGLGVVTILIFRGLLSLIQ